MQIIKLLKRMNKYLLARVVDEDSLNNSTYLKNNYKVGEVYEYVVCWNYDGEQWDNGTYFNRTNLQQALDKLDEGRKISYSRMSELATLFKDGLIEDDEDNAKEYFRDCCDMDDDEAEYFGLDLAEKEDEYEYTMSKVDEMDEMF